MQDDFEADSSERPDPELLAEDDLGGMMEASKTMDYDSDTSNDDPIDYEEEDERWEDERSEVDEPSQQVDDRDERNGPDDQPRRKRQKCDIPVLKDRKTAHEDLVASNLIVHRRSRVISGWLFAKNTRGFLHLKQPQKHLGLQGNGVGGKYGDGCRLG